MCGRYSDGGAIKCGMNLCCSYYGWCGVSAVHHLIRNSLIMLTMCQTDALHCGNPDPNGLTPCQAGFGLCQQVPPPSCGKGSGTTNGRTVGYYQASNTYSRACNRISPSQIVTKGLTHLYFAFAKVLHSIPVVSGWPADHLLVRSQDMGDCPK